MAQGGPSTVVLGNGKGRADRQTSAQSSTPLGLPELRKSSTVPLRRHVRRNSDDENSPLTLPGSVELMLAVPTEPREHTFASLVYYAPKSFFVCLALVLSSYFQIMGDPPLKLHTYWTDDPQDRGGGGFTCGCDLPASLQSLQYSQQKAADSGFNLNKCYDPSVLQDMNILMFSNSSAENVELLTRLSVDATKLVPGFMVEQQAHAIDGPLDSLVMYGPPNIGLKDLYPAGDRQSGIGVTVDNVLGTTFRTFPPDFLRMAFTYCSPCAVNSTECGIEAINQAFDAVLDTEKWGGCFLVNDNANECQQPNNAYQAKCTIYPTATIPSVFAVKSFLNSIKHTTQLQIFNVTSPQTWRVPWPYNFPNQSAVALEASIVYANHSRVIPSQVLLSFKQVAPQSAPWLYLSGVFPSLDSSCSSLSHMKICTGASLCSAFTNGGSLNVRCLDQSVLSNASFCETVFNESTLQNAHGLCKDLEMKATVPNNSQCECRDPVCHSIPPYLATWNTSKYLQSDPLNSFLYSRNLKNDWARRSGVCTNRYSKVIPYNPGETAIATKLGPQTILLQGDCLPKPDTNGNWTGSNAYLYCWVTGKYRRLTDLEDTDWQPLQPLPAFRNSSSGGRFVCYRISQERTFVWFIVIIGVVFGWAGSVDLIFHFMKWSKGKYQEYRATRRKINDIEEK